MINPKQSISTQTDDGPEITAIRLYEAIQGAGAGMKADNQEKPKHGPLTWLYSMLNRSMPTTQSSSEPTHKNAETQTDLSAQGFAYLGIALRRGTQEADKQASLSNKGIKK